MKIGKLKMFFATAIIAGGCSFNLSAFAVTNVSSATISGICSWNRIDFKPAFTKGSDVEITVAKETYLRINDPIEVGNITFKGSGPLILYDNGSLTCKQISYGTINFTYTYTKGDTGKPLVLNIDGTGDFTKDGIGEITMNLPIANTQTLTIANGKLTHTGGISGKLNIMRSGVYCEGQDEGINGSPTVEVNGILDMNTHYWTISNDACINLYPGSKVIGAGNGDNQAFEFQQASGKINVLKSKGDGGTARFESTIGLRSGDVMVDVEDGMVFDYVNMIGVAGDINHSLIATGQGIFKLEPDATLGEHWLVMDDGVLDLSAFTDTVSTKIKASNRVSCIFPYDVEDDEYTWAIDYDETSKILKVKKVHALKDIIGTIIYII
mgnify:CR=1 FL=1